MKEIIIERLKQPSTCKGIAAILAVALHIAIPGPIVDAITALAIAVLGAYEAVRDEYAS